jgi:hypothetical protein
MVKRLEVPHPGAARISPEKKPGEFWGVFPLLNIFSACLEGKG